MNQLNDRQKDKLKELAINRKWNKEQQLFHEECARTTSYHEFPYETPCGCYGHPHCGCDDPHYCHETQQYCWEQWEEVWDEKQQKMVEVLVDVRDKPEPIFEKFYFSFAMEDKI